MRENAPTVWDNRAVDNNDFTGKTVRPQTWKAAVNAPPVLRSITAEGGHSNRFAPVAAFTLTELLVVIAILALVAVTQLPALTGGKAPVSFTQCLNNLRRIGQATQLYMAGNDGFYPHGYGHVGIGGETNSDVWTMVLLRYLGNSTNQPSVYRCPSEDGTASNWAFQVHYTANGYVTDEGWVLNPVNGSQIKRPSIYWLFMEKSPHGQLYTAVSTIGNNILPYWNEPPGRPELRRHNGGFVAVACDGHVEWLRPPPYRPGLPAPQNFGELGDTSDQSFPIYWIDNGLPKKLYFRRRHANFPDISF